MFSFPFTLLQQQDSTGQIGFRAVGDGARNPHTETHYALCLGSVKKNVSITLDFGCRLKRGK